MSGTGVDAEFIEWARRRVGTMIKDKYRVEALLGVGGMACVYSATHRNGRRVALKILHPDLAIRGDLRTRFRREGQVANAVNHPGAVAVIDDDLDDDGSAFLVMELLEGQVVERLWEANRRRLSAIVVLAIAREVCEVLVAAHRAGIVHRDVKPENLFLTNDGRLKVLDFGLASLSDLTRSSDTHTGMVFGTPAFMPPEQAAGRVSQIDERTDIWSIGATMFTLLSGVTVHEGESAQHMVMLAAMEAARPLSDVLPDAHPALALLVDRALTHDKDMRWPNAAAMRDAICAASRTLFGEDRLELPRADELTLVGVPALPPAAETTQKTRTFDDDEQTRTDQNVQTLGDEAFPESEQTQRRERITPTMNDVASAHAPQGAGWSALLNVVEGGASPVPIGEPLEEATQLNATQVLSQPKVMVAAEERTSLMNIDLRGANPRVSGSYHAAGHPSGRPAPMKPRPPSLSPNVGSNVSPHPRGGAQSETTRIIARSRASMLPWMLTATAIAVALVAVGFAILSRTPKKPVPDLFAATPPPPASVVPRSSPPPLPRVVDAGGTEP